MTFRTENKTISWDLMPFRGKERTVSIGTDSEPADLEDLVESDDDEDGLEDLMALDGEHAELDDDDDSETQQDDELLPDSAGPSAE